MRIAATGGRLDFRTCRYRAGRAGLALAAGLLLLVSAAAAGAEPNSYSAMIEGLCRAYARAEVGEAPELAFTRCMAERHCRGAPGAPGYVCEGPQPLSWHGGGY